MMSNDVLETTCCLVGGGPAGVMLGHLFARRGIPVTVLDKHNCTDVAAPVSNLKSQVGTPPGWAVYQDLQASRRFRIQSLA
jgi:2-polyprenyl-6-methoxyphenol hydroxylase-like FAD-dependent oxidoreductase